MARRRPVTSCSTPVWALAASTLLTGCSTADPLAPPAPSETGWGAYSNQVWVGPEHWANRLQDWSLRDGRLFCENGTEARRTVHWLTREITGDGNVTASVRIDLAAGAAHHTAGAGMLIGVGEEMDWRSRALVHHWAGPGAGLWCGVTAQGEVFIRDNEDPTAMHTAPLGALDRQGWTATARDGALALWDDDFSTSTAGDTRALTVDLGQPVDFAGIAVQPTLGRPPALERNANGGAGPRTLRVESSADGVLWHHLTALELADGTAMALAAADGAAARYLRLEFNRGDFSSLAEFWLLRNNPAAQPPAWPGSIDLVVAGEARGARGSLRVQAVDPTTNRVLATIERVVPANRLRGGCALVSHPGDEQGAVRFAFQDWQLGGSALRTDPTRRLGPVACSQYTLHERTLKLTAQLLPMRLHPRQPVRLEALRGGSWTTVASARPTTPDYTVRFKVDRWDDSRDTPVRVVVPWVDRRDEEREAIWEAKVRQDPVDKPQIVVAGFTGNHNNSHAIGGGWGLGDGEGRTPPNHWPLGVWFPHTEIHDAVVAQQPDLLFFSGDQVYEGKSPSRVDRDNLALDYLYKWYLWCWAWQDLTRTVPSVCIPDDHDVYQGNLWGQGGRKAPGGDNTGGYVHPAWFVRMVELTQTSHLPDPIDPAPAEQGIGVYFTELNWGRVGFAIIEDRKWKSGCADVLPPEATPGRPDHIIDPAFDPTLADRPGTTLLGDRQLSWLAKWVADWRQQDMKMVLSQTIFASLSTHHGPGLARYEADLDSNGWPQRGRRKALEILRKGFPLHLAGDQHLASAVHHGIDEQRDALWSFCVPSVANFYPRAWAPNVAGAFDVQTPLIDCLGEFRDGLGNFVHVRAVTNPAPPSGKVPADLYDRMPGHGIVIVDKPDRTYEMQCWPRGADPSRGDTRQYPGWPIQVRQADNFAARPIGYLPRIEVEGLLDPVLTVYPQTSDVPVYSLRVRGREFRPPVYEAGPYRVVVGCPDEGFEEIINNLMPSNGTSSQPVRVRF